MTTKTAITQERTAFEAWARNQWYPLQRIDNYDNDYKDDRTQGVWGAWQARAAVEADRQDRMPSDDELKAWGQEEEFFLFCDPDEFLDIVKSALARYGSGQPAEGQEISIDISTGDHDAGRRAFGKLTGEVNPSAHGDVWLAEGYINEPAEDRSLGIATLKDVDAMIHILEKGKWGAEHVGKTPMSRRLKAAITKRLHGQLAASAIPMPTTKSEYIALLDLTVELGKKLNIAREDAFRAASGQPAPCAEPDWADEHRVAIS